MFVHFWILFHFRISWIKQLQIQDFEILILCQYSKADLCEWSEPLLEGGPELFNTPQESQGNQNEKDLYYVLIFLVYSRMALFLHFYTCMDGLRGGAPDVLLPLQSNMFSISLFWVKVRLKYGLDTPPFTKSRSSIDVCFW